MLLLFGSFLFSGCLTQQKREDITHRFLRENPKTLAELAAIHFPATSRPGIPVYMPGKPVVETRIDTLLETDTVWVTEIKTIRVTDTLRIVDTVQDDALLEVIMQGKFELDRQLTRTEVTLKYVKEQSRRRLLWMIGALVALTGSLGVALFRLLKPVR